MTNMTSILAEMDTTFTDKFNQIVDTPLRQKTAEVNVNLLLSGQPSLGLTADLKELTYSLFARRFLTNIADHADSMGLNEAYEFCARKLWRAKTKESKRSAADYQI